ncbi:MAG: hypothetical protein A3D50_00040 [Candidatus Taylorbacteria bacterium RIFCSPHIGHO2_02_FULL_44_12]|uniref:Prepilin peptidase n=1 Tax=Candidatus Taylorbacteria bacterium RIFCSPHIGHO2_02_FULL_44_12 TaxID=1802308 RepID=A0A1G2MKJ2_9BACT|nr:MAG: hypothetical protein A3D50_00040 [Candidatus Taylorbacteria bacterium RIFCSPHIGHO2_02_FULL_44_12]
MFPLIFSFAVGAIIGSFLNVLSLRFNTGVGIGGRSKCLSCGAHLKWKELIPLLSFVVQRGSCHTCKSKISWQYPLVEFSAGIIFTLILLRFPLDSGSGLFSSGLYLFVTCLLIVISVYDIKHKIIPDQFSYIFIAVAFIHLFIGGSTWFHLPNVWDILAGPILALPFFLLWLFSKGIWMGLGDAKLMVGIGWLLGLNGGINAVVLAFWIATGVSLIWMFSTYRKFKSKTEIPFGPYLILGMYIVLLFGVKVLDVGTITSLFKSYFGI